MKKLFCILSTILLCSLGHSIDDKTLKTLAPKVPSRPTLKIALYDMPPHVIADEKTLQPSGVAVQFLEQKLEIHKHFQVQWRIAPFARFLADLESGNADMGLLLAKTPERQKRLRFSDAPVFTTDAAVILRKEFPFTGLESLDGKILGHTQNSVVPYYFKDSGVRFDSLSGEDVVERNLLRLKLQRIDGVYVPTISNGEYLFKKLHMEKGFKIEKIPHSSLELYVVFRKDIDEKTFRHLNTLISKKHGHYVLSL